MSGRERDIETLFSRLAEADVATREATLTELRTRDPVLAAEVSALLAAHDHPTGPLERLGETLPPMVPADARVGQTVGRYAIEAVAGEGGMGVVYRARDLRLDREVALKFLPAWLGRDPLAKERLLAEARAVSGLDHPNVCTLHEIAEGETGELFLVMPFYEGETLKARLERGPLPAAEAVDIAQQVARGLAAAHARGVVHRDIKPGNLLLTPGGLVKLLDFGIAKATDLHLTRTGERLGTVAYMAPEQLAGDPVDGRTDLWALGVVLHEMLTGRRPRLGEPPDTMPTITSPQVADLVRLLLRVDPAARPPDAEAVVHALEGRDPSVASTSPSGWLLPTAIAAVALLAVLAWGAWGGGRAAAPATVRSVVPAGRAADITVAVLPFRLVGEGMEFWREGIVDLLTFNLDGLGGLRKIDPQAVATVWEERVGPGRDGGSHEAALDVARALGAHYAVLGTAVELQSAARLTAEVHDLRDGTLRGSTYVDGEADSVFALVDGLALALVRDRLLPVSLDAPMVNLERATTSSVPALKAYLEGERAYRLARWEDALGAYRRATSLDSTFARAWMRFGLAANWLNDRATAEEAHAIAMRHGDRLTARDRQLVSARTLADLAAYVARYPDDPEGWTRYGDGAFHHGGVHLLPADTSRVALQRAVRLLPHYGEAYSHLIEEAFTRRDSAGVHELLGGLSSVGGGRHTCVTDRHLADVVWGAAPRRAAARAALDTLAPEVLECAWTSLALVPAAADRLEAADLEPPRLAAPLPGLRTWRALHARLMRGEAVASHALLQRASANEVLAPFLAEHAVRLHLLGYLPATEVDRWVRRLEREATQDAHFWRGVLALHRGDRAAVEVHAMAIERAPTPPRAPLSDVAPRYAIMLRSLARLMANDTAALGALEQVLPTLPTMSVRRDHIASHVRYAVSQWLLARGDDARAEQYLRSFTHYEAFEYLPAQLALGTIYEKRGEGEAARRQYQLVAEWWAEADAPFHGMRDAARAGLRRVGNGPT